MIKFIQRVTADGDILGLIPVKDIVEIEIVEVEDIGKHYVKVETGTYAYFLTGFNSLGYCQGFVRSLEKELNSPLTDKS